MRMPFGKYKGSQLGELPSWYLRWLAELPDLLEPLLSAVLGEIEVRKLRDAEPDRERDCPDAQIANELIGAGVHALAKKYHPDVGGTNQQMQDVNAAAEWFRRVLEVKPNAERSAR